MEMGMVVGEGVEVDRSHGHVGLEEQAAPELVEAVEAGDDAPPHLLFHSMIRRTLRMSRTNLREQVTVYD